MTQVSSGAAVAPSGGPRRAAEVTWWIIAALGAALALAAAALVVIGPGERGTAASLRLTARLAFLFFWPSYAGGALVALWGDAFAPLKRRARALGLAFAAVLAVHLSLVAWKCWIGAPPPVLTFVIFSPAAASTGLLALASIERLGRAIGARGWWILRNVGLNYVAFAFAYDFLRPSGGTAIVRLIEYAPFAALAVLGPLIRLAAWLKVRLWRVAPVAR
jgi:hypothetical protein